MGLGATILRAIGAMLGPLLAAAALARDPVAPAPTSAERPMLTREDVGAFLDGFVPMALARGDIAGATVAVVKDGDVLFQRGYGYADVLKQQPVDPQGSLFRIGSVGKVFTWTAVMQLVERGQLDLDRDVNAYLDFEIAPRFGKAVTMRHLLTHTAGFEETVRDFFHEDAATLVPLGQYVRENLPARIFAPGTVVAYSNYGAALAGYVVERIAGEPFSSYVDEHIFAPLEMRHSTFEQPLPASLQPMLSSGYDRTSDGRAQPFEIGQAWPAGSLSTTAADMARFMLAYLNDGELGGQRILQPQTVQQMHARAYSTVPAADLNGMALGFYQEDRNGWRVVGHAGDTRWFHSNLSLILDAGVGLFISMNSNGRDGASDAIRFSLFQAFMDRYFPPAMPPPSPATLASAIEHGREISGSYVGSRRMDTTYFSLINLFAQATVSVDDEGVLQIDHVRGFNGQPLRWREVGDYVWQEVGGQAKLAAARDTQGRVTALITTDGPPVAVLQPAPGYMNKAWTLPLLIGAVVTLAFGIVLWPISAVVRRSFGKPLAAERKRGALILRLTSLINLVFIGSWLWLLLTFSDHITWFNDDLDPWLRLLQLAGLVGLGGTIHVTVQAVRSWRAPKRAWWNASGLSVIACAGIAVAWFALRFHMLSFSLR